jgi:cytochrome c peroxidase
MLAGRVSSPGPYGWHAQSPDLEARLVEGFHLHRWTAQKLDDPTRYEQTWRLGRLKAFLREGLRTPPRDASPLTESEQRGKALFESDQTACASCHPGATEFTHRRVIELTTPLPVRQGYAAEESPDFRVPSLLFVGGTPPYYHDGSAPSLRELIDRNGNRMGHTAQLSPEQRADLVAYLERL